MNILDLKMQQNTAEAKTVKEYLKKLLECIWLEGESFSSKRPFGESGWQYELYEVIVANKLVDIEYFEEIDPDEMWENIRDFDSKQADRLILDAINSL